MPHSVNIKCSRKLNEHRSPLSTFGIESIVDCFRKKCLEVRFKRVQTGFFSERVGARGEGR